MHFSLILSSLLISLSDILNWNCFSLYLPIHFVNHVITLSPVHITTIFYLLYISSVILNTLHCITKDPFSFFVLLKNTLSSSFEASWANITIHHSFFSLLRNVFTDFTFGFKCFVYCVLEKFFLLVLMTELGTWSLSFLADVITYCSIMLYSTIIHSFCHDHTQGMCA